MTNTNIIDRSEEYRKSPMENRKLGFRFSLLDKDDFTYFLKKSDLILCKRNRFKKNSEFYVLTYGYDNAGDSLAAACVIENPEPRKLFIKLFEVSPAFYRQGLGTDLFTCIKDFNHDRWYYCTYELEPLDDESTEFWKSLGFKEFINEEGEILMTKTTV